MTVVNPKSISGINSITMASGSDNLLTIHSNNTTERLRVDSSGNVTATSFVGSGANLTGVASTENIRTNTNATFLQNVTVVGTSTVTGNIVPSSDSATDIGTNSVRFQNAYVDTYYGDGSNLTGISGVTLSGSTNNTVATVTGANALAGESELNYSKESATQHMLVLGGTDDTASAWSGTRQGFKAIGTQPLLYLVDSDNTSGDDAYVGHASGVLYVAKRGGKLAFQTAASGGSTANRWTVESDGHMLPAANNTYDIGSSSYRVRNIYTNDLNLSNKGSQNDVDGTWGDYTIQEGEEDLFLINRRNGKKYKFNLTEVS